MKRYIYILLLLVVSITACEDEIADPCSSKFDQTPLFTNIADNLIVPAYKDLQDKSNSLSEANSIFQQAISIENLQRLRTAWEAAYYSWQTAAPYNFGPAEAELLRSSLNNYPANIEAITSNIAASTWDLEATDTYDKGFPALDYLLFGTGENEAEIVAYFNVNPAVAQYVNAIIEQIAQKTSTTLAAWENGYRDSFIANTGTADGSALSQIVNGINENYELLKRDKIGIPSGVVALGIPRPESVEARFSGISLGLTKTALRSNKDLFTGKSSIGLDDYLNEINAKKGEDLLSTVITTQYDTALAELDKISTNLRKAVETENEQVVEAYKAIATQVVHLKTDMTSVLCVAITYVDNPSDSD